MDIEQLRSVLLERMTLAADDVRRAQDDGDEYEAALAEVERDTLLLVIALIDEDLGVGSSES